jgi:L-asparagine oxygenase
MPPDCLDYELGPGEVDTILAIADEVRGHDEANDPRTPAFYDQRIDLTERMPVGLRRFLTTFRRTEPAAAAQIFGFPVDDLEIGPTPGHWDGEERNRHILDAEVFVALCGMALGEPFTWATLQGGRLIQNILPIPGDEQRQNGHGSDALLEFHTEDGFHPNRCDYLLLLGVRNEDKVATTVASVRDVRLDPADAAVLSERRFHIFPDDEHIRQLTTRQPDHPALGRVLRMRDDPEPVAVLFGNPERPYLRIDLPFMRCVGDDPTAQRALAALQRGLEENRHDAVVEQGSLLVVDNYVAVHGRRPFRARYDGTDRWLKKLTVSRNLRINDVVPLAGSPRVII